MPTLLLLLQLPPTLEITVGVSIKAYQRASTSMKLSLWLVI